MVHLKQTDFITTYEMKIYLLCYIEKTVLLKYRKIWLDTDLKIILLAH